MVAHLTYVFCSYCEICQGWNYKMYKLKYTRVREKVEKKERDIISIIYQPRYRPILSKDNGQFFTEWYHARTHNTNNMRSPRMVYSSIISIDFNRWSNRNSYVCVHFNIKYMYIHKAGAARLRWGWGVGKVDLLIIHLFRSAWCVCVCV